MTRDTIESPVLEELGDRDIVPGDSIEAPTLLGDSDVTPVNVDPCPECNRPLTRIRSDTPAPQNFEQAWRLGKCVSTLDGYWKWCQVTGWLRYGELRIQLDRRSSHSEVPSERRRGWTKPSAD